MDEIVFGPAELIPGPEPPRARSDKELMEEHLASWARPPSGGSSGLTGYLKSDHHVRDLHVDPAAGQLPVAFQE